MHDSTVWQPVQLSDQHLIVRAVRSRQGAHELFAFFAPGRKLIEVAEVSRLKPSLNGVQGFQRPEIRQQVRAIADYLLRGSVLFPNAIILAISPEVRFVASRGTKPGDVDASSEAGTLHIPINPRKPAAWIVDGQQRSLALNEVGIPEIAVPVVAFVSKNIDTQREQFILVNKSRPLPARLIDELLPEVNAQLPADLAPNKIPSALCAALNESIESPFYGLIRRPSNIGGDGVVIDSSLMRVMKRSIKDPRGALAMYNLPGSEIETDSMFAVMVTFWSAVREVFPEAWGLPPEKSRLMHSAGIESMGVLMDQLMSRKDLKLAGEKAREVLSSMKPYCRWTEGEWETINRRWDDIQNTTRDVRLLTNALITLEREVSQR